MSITKVWIEDGCTACNLCEDTCPDVFVIEDDNCKIKEGADFAANADDIEQAAEDCPVEVIKYE